MADFPNAPLTPLGDDRSGLVISTYSGWSLGPAALVNSGFSAVTWPVANQAIYVPFRVPTSVLVTKLACGTGTGTTGNFDLGIYDAAGNRIVSSGSTAKTTASSERIVDITDTRLLPGLYYLAMATDGVTQYTANTFGNVGMVKLLGSYQQGTAFALPATATFATRSTGFVPAIAAYLDPA